MCHNVSTKVRVLPSGTSRLRKFHNTIGRYRNVLSTWLDTGGRSERDKLDRSRSAELTTPTCDDRPLVYHSNHHALSTARCRRAGLFATADTCLIRCTSRCIRGVLIFLPKAVSRQMDKPLRYVTFYGQCDARPTVTFPEARVNNLPKIVT